jgi:hypothetical protein
MQGGLLPNQGEDGIGYPWACKPNPSKPSTTEAEDCKPCAWPARFEGWLKKAYPHKKVTVLNVARGGVGSTACVGMLGGILKANDLRSKVDVVLINFVHNDDGELSKAVKRARNRVEAEYPGVVDKHELEALRAPLVKAEQDALLRDHEALIREVLSLPSKPAVLEIELVGAGGQNAAGVYSYHAPVMERYQVIARHESALGSSLLQAMFHRHHEELLELLPPRPVLFDPHLDCTSGLYWT